MAVMDDGGLSLRSKWGLRFSRSALGGKSPNYSGTREEKARFREEWVKSQFEHAKLERTRKTEYRHIDKKKGTYRPFSMIWKKQGGNLDPTALQAAKNIASACIKMGGAWVQYNTMSKRVEYLDLERGFETEFEKSWALFERRQQQHAEPNTELAANEEMGGVKGEQEGEGKKQGEEKDDKNEGGEGQPDKDKGKGPKDPQKIKKKSSLDVALGEALQMKKDRLGGPKATIISNLLFLNNIYLF